jgi:tetratricopeptide (TPR) repeat protein
LNRLTAFITAVGLAVPVSAQQGQLDSDITLFTVLAALNAAGYDTGLDSPSTPAVRHGLRRDLQNYQGPTRDTLRAYYQQHKAPDPLQDLSQWVSFALQSAGPPDFKFRVSYDEVSPDAQPLHEFSALLAAFYQEAGIEKLFAKYQPEFDKEIERYHEPVVKVVWEANGYLRIPTSGYLGRRFQVYFDLLSAPASPSARSYGPDVFVVIHPSRELHTREIRHTYLHYLLDPFSSKYAKALQEKQELGRLAMFAPALDEAYKTDFALLVTECLIKAVEARTRHGSEAQRQAEADQSVREGFILTAHFYEQLQKFEKQEQGIRFYYPEMIQALERKREDARLRSVTFLERRPDPKPKAEPRPLLTGLAKTLADAEDAFRQGRLPDAKRLFGQAQQEAGGRDARTLYGLARVAAMEKDPERAKELFHQALEARPDPHVQAMTHVYLGRIEDLFGSREQAVQHYQAALAAGDTTPGTREAAQKGLQESFAVKK